MRWLKAVIARLRPTRSPATATPTPSAGHAPPEPMPSTGSKPTALATSHQHLPASLPASASSEAVQPTTAASSSGKKTRRAATTKQSRAVGTKPATPARPTRQRAKPAAKASKAVALPIPPALLSASAKALALIPTANQSGVNGKPKAAVPQTHPPAKSAQRPKQKPAKRGSSGKKTSAAKALVRTPTDNPSGVNGT
jgi:hypothetical protein